MTTDTLLMVLGVFVATLPFLGFPQSSDTVLFVIAGIFVVALGIVVRRRGLRTKSVDQNTFSENASALHEEEMAQ